MLLFDLVLQTSQVFMACQCPFHCRVGHCKPRCHLGQQICDSILELVKRPAKDDDDACMPVPGSTTTSLPLSLAPHRLRAQCCPQARGSSASCQDGPGLG